MILYKEINKVGPRKTFTEETPWSLEQGKNFQDQHYEQPHFDYLVGTVDNEYETQIARSPGKVVLKSVNKFLWIAFCDRTQLFIING